MQTKDKEEIRQAVRESYGKIARAGNVVAGISPTVSCCGESNPSAGTTPTASCCGGGPEVTPERLSALMGYSKQDLAIVPEGANMGLGCGNPVALVNLNKPYIQGQ